MSSVTRMHQNLLRHDCASDYHRPQLRTDGGQTDVEMWVLHQLNLDEWNPSAVNLSKVFENNIYSFFVLFIQIGIILLT
jgi:hypothetical protein